MTPESKLVRNELVRKFAEQMRRELDAPVNAAKGDDWIPTSVEEHRHEIMYHLVKLLLAVEEGDLAGIREFTADTANHLAMLADSFGVLDNPDYTATEYHGERQRQMANAMIEILFPALEESF